MRLYRNRLHAPRRVLELVESSSQSPATRYEARRQFIVSVCAAFECYWRSLVRLSLDEKSIPEGSLQHLNKISFTLGDVQSVVGKRLTIGELVACSFSFQGPDAVNKALSEILQIKYFSDFGSQSFRLEEVVDLQGAGNREPAVLTLTGVQLLRNFLRDVEKCFEIRHDTVHNTGALHRVSDRRVPQIENSVWQFNLYMGLHLEHRVDRIWGYKHALRK